MGYRIFSILLLLAAFCQFFCHKPIALAKADTSLIQKTCKTTKYYDLCVSALKSDPTSKTSDTKGLATIMTGVAMTNATSTSSFLSSLVFSSTSNDPIMGKVLKDCADKYTLAGDALRSSAQDLALENYDYASMHIMAAADYPNVCHNEFKRHPALAYPPELSRRGDGFKRICDVVLDIIDLLGPS